MKALLLSRSDVQGGAARATYRIHHALRSSGIDSEMLVNEAVSGDWTVKGPTTMWMKGKYRLRKQFANLLWQLADTKNPILHSPALLRSEWPERLNKINCDVVHLHWVQYEMISVTDIPRIKRPIVWTLHDMWAFCGAEHLSWDNRWRDGYHHSNRPKYERWFDLNRYTWLRKRKYWRRPIHIVCPSKWLSGYVQNSALMHDWPVTVLPNPIDTNKWKPIEKRQARDLLDLPQDCPIIGFGAIGGSYPHHKGFDLLLAALNYLKVDPAMENIQLVIFGQNPPKSQPTLGFPVHYTGHLHDDLSLKVVYNAIDTFVIPSRQDNFPNTGLEAHACGTPVVAFNTCGLPEIVDNYVTGSLAKPFDPASLADSIRWVLEDSSRLRKLGESARARAVRLWNPTRIADKYLDVYNVAIESTLGKVNN